MGVTGLLPELKEIQTPASLEKYRGQTLAVDTYGWLHRAVVSCAPELCQNLPTRKYVSSVMRKVMMLRHFGVEPYLVFDGDHLPTKAATEESRRTRRQTNLEEAAKLLEKGDRKGANKSFMKAADVSTHMAKSLIEELKLHNVKYVVAPYEADPQMVYLEKKGVVDGILSEDSDLLIFGCKKLITKLNDRGECVEILRDDFNKCRKAPMGMFSQPQLRVIAMLSGCDYTKGIPGVGFKGAIQLVKRHSTMEKVIIALRSDGTKVPDTFADEVNMAELAFQYQKVYCPLADRLGTLNELPVEVPEGLEEACGKTYEAHIHKAISRGDLDPFTKKPLVTREQNLHLLTRNKTEDFSKTRNTKVGSVTAKRTLSTPNPKKMSIDSFFKPASIQKPTQQINDSRTLASVSVNNNTSIARKVSILNDSTPKKDVSSTSKFFSNRDQVVPSKTVEITLETQISDDLMAPASPQIKKSAPTDINSSDFDLTDPDMEERVSQEIWNNKSEDNSTIFSEEFLDELADVEPIPVNIPKEQDDIGNLKERFGIKLETPSAPREILRMGARGKLGSIVINKKRKPLSTTDLNLPSNDLKRQKIGLTSMPNLNNFAYNKK